MNGPKNPPKQVAMGKTHPQKGVSAVKRPLITDAKRRVKT
jgi:hypothetical protein